MHFKVPDYPIAIAMLWAWMAIVCTAAVVYWAFRRWRKRHPPPKLKPPISYASALRERFEARHVGQRLTKGKPRPKPSPRRT